MSSMTTEKRLAEREKELTCIYAICLLAAGAPEPEIAAEGIARALRSAMQRDDLACCMVSFKHKPSGRQVQACRGAEDAWLACPDRNYKRPTGLGWIESHLPGGAESGDWEGSIRVEYPSALAQFLPQEKALLDSVLVVASSILRTASLIENLKSASTDLSSKNIALREVLRTIEDERRRSLAAFRKRLAVEILPIAERARDAGLTAERRRAYLDLLVDELGRDIAAFGPDPVADSSLSLREREIAVQVRNGRTSKEIAELLGIAESTVERHRHNIRKKLRIAKEAVNLAGLLSNSDSVEPLSKDRSQ